MSDNIEDEEFVDFDEKRLDIAANIAYGLICNPENDPTSDEWISIAIKVADKLINAVYFPETSPIDTDKVKKLPNKQ